MPISKIRKKILKERKDYILSELEYENNLGPSTILCECGKHSCRNMKCAACWKADLDKVNEELKK